MHTNSQFFVPYLFQILNRYSRNNEKKVNLMFRLWYKFYLMVKYAPAGRYEGVENACTPSLIDQFFKFVIEDS